MLKLAPLLFALIVAVAAWKFSAFTSGRALRAASHPLRNDRIELLLTRLARAAGVQKVHVRVLEQQAINGLATPSGEIYVTEGLVGAFHEAKIAPEELASVIAHELGHLALGHTKRRMIDMAGAQAIQLVVGGVLARLIPFVGWHLARLFSRFFVAALSRKDEFEADAFATALMIRAGLGAEPQARMLEKLVELSPGAGRAPGVQWLASHPPVPARAAAIRENARRWQDGVPARI